MNTLVAGRYRLKVLLKEALGVRTYEGADCQTGDKVIVKLSPEEPHVQSLQRLEHQAQILNQLPPGSFAAVRALGREDDLAYLVVERVEGNTLAETLQSGPLPAREVALLGVSLARSLSLLHGLDICHRDIKPSNIILGPPPQHRPTLIDFGLARNSLVANKLEEQPVGAALYISPEQAGVIAGQADARSDLYSLGIVLYEALTGHAPFRADNIGEILRRHLTEELPVFPAALRIPAAFGEILAHLTAKDPRDRYQTALGLAFDLENLLRHIDAGETNPQLILGRTDRRRNITEPSFVGRENEMRLCLDRIQEAQKGRPSLICVEASSGGGKTRFIHELAPRSAPLGTRFFHGQAVSQTAPKPLQLLRGVVREALEHAAADADLRRALDAVFGEHAEALSSVFPEFQPQFDFRGHSAPAEFGEFRVVEAFCALLERLGTSDRPAVIVFDDCQWADELFLRFLQRWNERRAYRLPQSVLVVVSFRSEEVSIQSPLRKLSADLALRLPKLDTSQLRSLLESMAGPVPREAVSTVTRLSDGSPFMAAAILRGMAESGALQSGQDGWRMDETYLGEIQSSVESAAFLVRRMDMLPSKVREFLTAGAILGKVFDSELAAALSGITDFDREEALDLARKRGLIWEENASRTTCRFVHDKLREALLDGLSPARRSELHRLAAMHIENKSPDLVFDLAFHFDAAGDAARAFPYALSAAEHARKQYGLHLAEEHYRIALRGVLNQDISMLLRVQQGLGEVLLLQGCYAEAESCLEAARASACSEEEESAVLAALGDLSFKKGDMDSAGRRLRQALRLLGRSAPEKPWQMFLQFCVELLRQVVHSVFPTILGRRSLTGRQASKALAAASIYSRLAYVNWFQQGRLACAWAHLKNLNLTEQYPPTPQLAQAYSEHGPVMTMLPWFSRGIAYARRSYEMRRALGDVWGQGQSLHFWGVALYGASRFDEAREKLEQASELLERTGDRWERNTARWHTAYCHYRRGDLKEAARIAKSTYQDSMALGDFSSAGISITVWAKANQGDVPGDIIVQELSRNHGDAHTFSELQQAEALRLVREGKFTRALEALQAAWKRVSEAHLRQEYVAPVLPWTLTVARMRLEKLSAYESLDRARSAKHARKVGRAALRIAQSYRNNLPHVYRELGYLALLEGKMRKAMNHLEQSLEVAQQQGARYEEAQGLIAKSFVLRAMGSPAAESVYVDGQKKLKTIISATEKKELETQTLSLLDRFDAVLNVGRYILASKDAAAVVESVQRAAIQLLRCSRCCMINVSSASNGGSDLELTVVGQDSEVLYSRSLVLQAIAAERPVIADETKGIPTSSMSLANTRSAICAPVYVDGRISSVLYAAHDRAGRIFREEEERLCAFISALAGAALENTVAIDSIRLANASLERDIEERARMVRDLASAKEASDAANRSKTEFLANMSHEIRTPLGAIMGFAELLQQDGLDEADREKFLTTIRRNGEHLLSILNDLLDLSRIESGKLDIERVPVSLQSELERMLQTFEPKFLEKKLHYELELDPGIPPLILLDPTRFKQIVANLLSNAVKFSNTHGQVRVRAHLVDEPAGIEIRVEDTGIGLSVDQQRRLFQPFTQADPSMSRKYGGSGLGLALSRKLAHAMGGELFLERSDLGRGSCFTLHFDESVFAIGNTARTARIENVLPLRPLRKQLDGVRVLLVEDNPDNQDLYRRMLREAGAFVAVAANGQIAIDMANEGQFDLVFMDLQMPLVDGYEAIQRLRGQGKRFPIIALTAHGMSSDKERCLQLGCNDYLVKPVAIGQILKSIDRFIPAQRS